MEFFFRAFEKSVKNIWLFKVKELTLQHQSLKTMDKKKLKTTFVAAIGTVMMTLPASAQWTNYDTQSTIRGVFGLANAALESAERKKEMEILARQKVEFEQSFQDAMTEEAKEFDLIEPSTTWQFKEIKCK